MTRFWTVDALWMLLLAALLVLQVWFPFSGPALLNDTYSVEISGRRAVYELAEARFSEVRRNHRPLSRVAQNVIAEDEALCIVGPARYPTPGEWDRLLEWVADGGRLLIAAPLRENQGFEIPKIGVKVVMPATSPEELIAAKIKNPNLHKKAGVTSRLLRLKPEVRWLSAGSVTAPAGATPLVDCDDGLQAVRVGYGEGWVVVCASDYIFTNGSLNDEGRINPYLAWRLLKTVGGERGIVFDESLNAAAQPTIEGLLLSDSIRPATIQVCVLLVIFAWSGTRRFGGLLPKTTRPRHDIVSHTDALGNLYFKRNDSFGTLKRYFDQWRTELRLGTHRKDQAQVERLARRTDSSVGQVKRLLTDTEGALSNRRLTRRDAARLIARLAEFREKVRVT